MRSACLLVVLVACGTELKPEDGELYPGGDTTNLLVLGSQAFTFPATNLSSDRRAPFFSGNAFFNQAWVAAPASTTARDGVGPTYNAVSCSGCHFRDGRGAPPDATGEPLDSVLIRLSVPGTDPVTGAPLPDPVYGDQLQPFAVRDVPGEADVVVRWEDVPGTYVDGTRYTLRRPRFEVVDLAFGDMDPQVRTSARVAPQMIGLGLLEAIDEAELRAMADPEDADSDGISGRLQRAWDPITETRVVGRFGWKSEQPTVHHQTAGAFLGDMGLTSSLFPDENCPPAQPECGAAPDGGAPEVEDEILARVVFYARTLAVPARRSHDDPEVLHGRELFRESGCGSCHAGPYTTGDLEGLPELSGQYIWPYTDLLLHDMGPELDDGRPVFDAEGSEWRTPPLWGIGLFDTVNGHTSLLHDGRARGVAEAILWHGGEAEAARERFREMSASDRAALIRFVESL